MTSYKARQEEWVTGLTGTTPWEVQSVLNASVSAILVFRVLAAHLPNYNDAVARGAVEYVIFVLPFLAAISEPQLASWLFAAVIGVSVAILTYRLPGLVVSPIEVALNERSKPFLNMFRANVILMTVITILAVDFPVFPRRFAKTETLGYSVMDIGVGAFIGSNALVSGGGRARSASMWRTFKSVIPLFGLGVARLASVTSLDYQSHASEYGVHWNFFITLGCIQVIFALIKNTAGESSALLTGIVISLSHEAVLRWGLADYVENAPRVGILAANKEGLASMGGYAGLFMVMVAVSRFLLSATRRTYNEWTRLCRTLWVLTAASGLVTAALYLQGEHPSRKLMNGSYIVWAVTTCLFSVTTYLTVDLVSPPTRSLLFDAINRNQLAVFLGCNLMTGAVNMSMRTLDASWSTSQAVLVLYSLVATTLAIYAHKRAVTIKFW